jgi:hypothetical protein
MPELDDHLAGWVGTGVHPDTFLPEPEMPEDAPDHLPVIDEREDAHFARAFRAPQQHHCKPLFA